MKELQLQIIGLCPLCEREMAKGVKISEHHLIPKCKGGKKTVYMHNICHQKIHSVFSEKELASEYYYVEKLQAHPEMKKFINWVKSKPIDFYDSNLDTRFRYRKRKRR